MSESYRRTQLIKNVIGKITTKKSLMIEVDKLKKERPQLFHGTKDSAIYTPIKDSQDIEDLRNNMACGNYPLGMTDCEVVGINGDCGISCPVFQSGNCDSVDEGIDAGSWTKEQACEIGYEFSESNPTSTEEQVKQ